MNSRRVAMIGLSIFRGEMLQTRRKENSISRTGGPEYRQIILPRLQAFL